MIPIDDQRNQIAEALRVRFFPLIPRLPANWSDEQHDKNRLSRALTAFALAQLASVSSAQAANAIVDGGNDNGIDGVLLDRAEGRLWLIQSKAGGAPDLGECKKFAGGIRDLLARRFDRFNTDFGRLQPDVEEALETDRLKIVGCVVHQGEQIGSHAIADFNAMAIDLNQFVDRFEWRDCGVAAIYGWLTSEHAMESIDVQVSLENWHGIAGPRKAFYGLVTASELAALYRQHGKALFQKNIRYYMGLQSVNSAIAATVQDRPTDFFYLNNGLTAVCSVVRPLPGGTNDAANFITNGFSIVNGAQTVGSIAAAAAQRAIPPDAKVLLTLIEVTSPPDGIGPEITRARNTQNAVRGIHFAALDVQQERLRQELAVSGIAYHYRPSDEANNEDPASITLARAAIALACLSGDTRVVVAAKRESGQLYDGSGLLYGELFRERLSGIQLARSVQIYDYAMNILFSSELAEASGSRRKMFYRHGRMFVLHIFARRHRTIIKGTGTELTTAEKSEVSRGVTELAEFIYSVAESTFTDGRGYLSIFRNLTDCIPLAARVMHQLMRPSPAARTAGEPAADPRGDVG
jgi:hypothetical protein